MRSTAGILAVWTLAAFLARGTIGDLMQIAGVKPDLLTTVVVYWSLALGPILGTMAGFAVGLVADAELGHGLGVQAGLLSLVGFLVGQLGRGLVKENLLMQGALVAACTLVLASSRILLTAGGNPAVLFSAGGAMLLGQTAYSAVFAPFVYWLIRFLGLPDPLTGGSEKE